MGSIARETKDRAIGSEIKTLSKKLVLEDAASKGTQTLTERLLSTSMDNLPYEEKYGYLKREITKIIEQRDRIEAQHDYIPDYLDEFACSDPGTKLMERFAERNLNLVKEDTEDFKIFVDCQQFKPNGIKVAVEDGRFVVRAHHDTRFDDHGLIKREFTRSWPIPEDVKYEKFSCFLDQHGILTIRAPRKPASIIIPIQIEKPPAPRDY